jgi:hypothetical protein
VSVTEIVIYNAFGLENTLEVDGELVLRGVENFAFPVGGGAAFYEPGAPIEEQAVMQLLPTGTPILLRRSA